MLQWGRASSARKTPRTIALAVDASPLQWGRASSARKAATTTVNQVSAVRFNGAVLHQHGRQALTVLDCTSEGVASMGPCFISTEGNASASKLRQIGWSASMGPCFISTEGTVGAICERGPATLQWGRASSARKTRCVGDGPDPFSGFNGAVLHQHGRLLIQRLIDAMEWLQWGRASSARKALHPESQRGVELASMGPCFISTEGLVQHSGNLAQVLLQWGRASSARKTRRHRTAAKPPCRFNGAVLHQHGRPQ